MVRRLAKTLWARRGGKPSKAAHFVLRYVPPGEQDVTVGHLEFAGGIWTFRYDSAYKQRHELRPIEGFDDLDRVYQSSALFPFFAVRIPDIDRDDVKRRLAQARVKDPEPTELLAMFGRKVLSSPAFELEPA